MTGELNNHRKYKDILNFFKSLLSILEGRLFRLMKLKVLTVKK